MLFLICSTATSLLSAWALGAEGRGELTIITTWLFVSALVGTLGLHYAQRYWVARQPDWTSEIFSNTIAFTFVASVVAIVIAWQLIPSVIGDQPASTIRLTQLFLLNIPIILLSEMLRGYLEGARIFGWLGAARLSFIGIQAVFYLVFYVFDRLTLETALAVIIGGQIVSVALMFAAVIINLRPAWRLSLTVFKAQLSYGLRSYVGILTEFAVWRLDQVLLTALAPSRVVGLYAVAVAIAEITATLAASISDALLPEVAASSDADASLLLLARSLRLTVYAQVLALIPLWIAAPFVLGWVFGADFVEATATLRILLCASIFWSAGLIVISGLSGLGNPGLSTFARIASAVTTVVALVILLPAYGMLGAAISSLLGYALMLAVGLFFLLRRKTLKPLNFFRPRRDDLTFAQLKSLAGFSSAQPSKAN